jgi:uncharacterized protein (TIGR03435 family)
MALSIRPSAAQAVTAEFKAPPLEVVSVRPVKESGGPSVIQIMPDGLSATGVPMDRLIRSAFGARFFGDSQIVGVPIWANSERYDIAGKVSEADVAKLRALNNQQKQQMLQAMLQEVLAERFGMKVHEEDREGPIYVLVVAKNGPKLKEATSGDTYSNGFKDPGGRTLPAGSKFEGPGQIVMHAVTSEELAKSLNGRDTGRVVVDETGLTGTYDFTLTWTPDRAAASPRPEVGATADTSMPSILADASGPSIFTAIQEQLGLKLEPAKGLMKTLVIDHIERPSEN